MIVKDGAVVRDHTHHFSQARALPVDIILVRHAVVMMAVAILERGVFPFATTSVFHAIAGRVLQIIGWGSDDEIDGTVGYAGHDFYGIAANILTE